MKKLLFITPGFAKDESETYVVPFIQHVLLAFGEKYPDVKLTVVAVHRPVAETFNWNGVRIIPLNGDNVKFPAKIKFLFRSFHRIKNLIKEEEFDGVLNFWYNEFSVMTHFLNKRTFTWMLGQDVRKSNHILKFFKPRSKKTIALSHYNNEILFESCGVSAYKVIPVGIDENAFPDLNIDNRPIDIFAAGWLSAVKNFSLMIEVIAELKNRFPNIRAELAGTGSLGHDLKEQAAKLGLDENLIFLGQLSHHETLEKMNNAKIFLHTATFEGGPTVYFESLYAGCQLIGMLPMTDKPLKNFHFCQTKDQIVNKATELLEDLPVAERVSYYSMEYVVGEIYDLFF